MILSPQIHVTIIKMNTPINLHGVVLLHVYGFKKCTTPCFNCDNKIISHCSFTSLCDCFVIDAVSSREGRDLHRLQ